MQPGSLLRGRETRRNYAINPSFETNELNWVNASGGVRTQISSNPLVGSKCLQVTFAAAGTFKYVGQSVTIPAGNSFVKASIAVRRISGAGFAKMRVGYRDGVSSGTITYGPLTDGVALSSGWTLLSVEQEIPSTTQHLVVIAYGADTAGGTSVSAGSSWAVDALTVSLGGAKSTTPEAIYFDGSTSTAGSINEWAGAPHRSESVQYEALGSDVRSYRSRVLVNGVERTHLSWRLGRDLLSDLPEQVSASAGITQASGTIRWGTRDDVSGVVTPWNPSSGWVPTEGDRVQIFVSHGTMEWQQFEGVVDDVEGDSSEYGLTSKIVDRIDDFSRPVNLPSIIGVMPPIEPADPFRRVGITPRYHLMVAMRRAGYFVTPPAEFGVVASIPAVGSMWPLTGTCLSCVAVTNPGLTPQQSGIYMSNATANYSPSTARAAGTTTQVTLCTDGVNPGVQAVTLYYGATAVALRVGGGNVSVRVNGTPIISADTSGATIFQVLLKSGSARLRTNAGTDSSAAYSPGSGSTEMTRVNVYADSDARFNGVQVSHPTQVSHEFASVGFTPTATVATGDMHDALAASAATQEVTCRDHLEDIGQSLLIPFWLDEKGHARAVQSDLLRAQGAAQIVNTRDDVTRLSWSRNLLGARSQVSANYDEMEVVTRRDYSLEVWASGETVSLGSGEEHLQIAQSPDDELWVMVDESLTVPGVTPLADANKGIGSMSGGVYTDGVNEAWATLPADPRLAVSLSRVNEGTWRFKFVAGELEPGKRVELRTWSSTFSGNTELWPYYWDKELARLRAKGRVRRMRKTRTPSIIGDRGPQLVLECGSWATGHLESNRTRVVDAIVDYVSSQVINPQPVIQDLGVIADPRRQLGDVVIIRSEKLLGVELRCLIVGVNNEFTRQGFRQSLSVRIISFRRLSVTYSEWDQQSPTQTYSEFTALSAQTYEQFTSTPEDI